MRKLPFVLIAVLLLFTSCAAEHSFTENSDGSITMDTETYYPIENSYRFTDYGKGKKQGSILGADIYIPEGEDTVLLAEKDGSRTYYVPESLRGFDKPLEECTEFFFVKARDIEDDGRISRDIAESARIIKGKDAEDLAFYVFYGRPPQDYGLTECLYVGELFCTFPELDSILSSYPVYGYGRNAFSIVIDGEEYLMDEELARMMGIIT